MQESSRVLIMGHKNPDMDALGSAIGILKLAEMNDKEAHIVFTARRNRSRDSPDDGRDR